ncbi:pathogenicity locus [Methanobacterium subterraneum]|uniref:Pathogenicity locus n=1 Tax=Methanobacterium subterraneum TaxID=59277 RepID=A0A2H4VBK4_9EURY|nr:helix-hairpin-helix domain-containing protein [Methanobacterium subterraneum]AUB55466.1 pathogenicity locus [Methanobacterium subterraneum]
MSTYKISALKDIKQIPGVGDVIAEDLWDLGIRSPEDLKDQDPEELYLQLCALQDTKVDKCMLYVFRCVVYYVSHDKHEAELLKWWNWKYKKE